MAERARKMTDLLIPFANEETALRVARLIAERCNVRGIMLCDGLSLAHSKLARQIDLRSVAELLRDAESAPPDGSADAR